MLRRFRGHDKLSSEMDWGYLLWALFATLESPYGLQGLKSRVECYSLV